MNAGRVEQLGAPADLYENPRTTFVANFLGTSNLIEADVLDTGADVLVTAGGGRLRVPADRCPSTVRKGGKLLVGVRPEKISLAHADDAGEIGAARNRVTGRIADSSFIGVSTQYVVNSPAGAELQVYEQNVERRAGLLPGTEVVLHWNPAHTFGLDADQDIDAGVETVEDAL
jgi:spermidine/putrescine transport system ATP-binding protein